MPRKEEDSFRPKVGAPKSKGSAPPRFVTRVLKAAAQAGPVAGGRLGPQRARLGAKLGRGVVAARLAGRSLNANSRRVTIKTRLVTLRQANPRSTEIHIRYLERDGITSTAAPGRAYGEATDEVDVKAFERQGQGDRHQFRFIVSTEEGMELKDLGSFTRQLMRQMERDLGTRLDWIAVDHWDTGHPHTHIVLRGKDQNGRDLVIARDYIAHGMRARAREIATEWLGPRTQQEIEATAVREVTQERWTGLDATIQQESIDGILDVRRLSGQTRQGHERSVMIGRLQHLSTMGLANESQSGIWHLAPTLSHVLHAMGERGDIIRTMQRAISKAARDYQIFDPATPSQPVTGRIVGKGLHDDLSDRGYLVIDGLDGRAHYAALAADIDITTLPMGAIVEVRSAATRSVDRHIAAAAVHGIYRTEHHLARLRAQEPRTQEPQALVQAHVRRLEALRRRGIVERISEGVWKIPANLPEQGRAFDLKQLGGASVDLRCHLSIERQIRAMGATWLDQQLSQGLSEFPNTDFGASIRNALKQREEFLIDQGLASRVREPAVLARGLLTTLRDRELAAAGARIETSTGLVYRSAVDGILISGKIRESVQLASGRFAMLEDGLGFSLVPWRPVVEKRLGQHVSAMIQGSWINWEVGRSRDRSL